MGQTKFDWIKIWQNSLGSLQRNGSKTTKTNTNTFGFLPFWELVAMLCCVSMKLGRQVVNRAPRYSKRQEMPIQPLE